MPGKIQAVVEANLAREAHFKDVKVRSIEGEMAEAGEDDFIEWRYCLGPYSQPRERMMRFLESANVDLTGEAAGPVLGGIAAPLIHTDADSTGATSKFPQTPLSRK